VKAEAALEVPGGTLLVGMAGDQRGVEVDRQPPRRAGQLPHARTGVGERTAGDRDDIAVRTSAVVPAAAPYRSAPGW
jgi:hypothetical protein